MKVTTSTVSDILSHLRLNFLNDSDVRKYEEPFRSELYSSDQMDRHGKAVARSHKPQKRHSNDKLLKRLESNEKSLLEVRNLLVESIRSGKTITPASEWLHPLVQSGHWLMLPADRNGSYQEIEILLVRTHVSRGR